MNILFIFVYFILGICSMFHLFLFKCQGLYIFWTYLLVAFSLYSPFGFSFSPHFLSFTSTSLHVSIKIVLSIKTYHSPWVGKALNVCVKVIYNIGTEILFECKWSCLGHFLVVQSSRHHQKNKQGELR